MKGLFIFISVLKVLLILVFHYPAAILVMLYRLVTNPLIERNWRLGDKEEAYRLLGIMKDSKGEEFSHTVKHTACVFWLTILALIIYF